ncbi:MAG: hypothetical protein FWD54_04000 [Endomicrobia bacterium]|nr:hypothetical protein [Endomicrobiia bacterium]MCL2799419.1 hypothetical protein [Endomicrobiia bacterium]
MILTIYLLSLLFLVLGWLYYAKPDAVQKINDFFKTNIFNDKHILIKRRKIAVVFFFASLILCITAFACSNEEKNKIPDARENSSAKEIIIDALVSYKKALASEPRNITLLTKSAYAYEALGEKNKASSAWKTILAVDPENETAKQRLNVK